MQYEKDNTVEQIMHYSNNVGSAEWHTITETNQDGIKTEYQYESLREYWGNDGIKHEGVLYTKTTPAS